MTLKIPALNSADWIFSSSDIPNGKRAEDLLAINFHKAVREQAKQNAPSTVEEEYQRLLCQIENDPYLIARFYALAAGESFSASAKWEEYSKPVQTHLALFLKENGLLQYLEMDNIIDFLESKRSDWDGTGSRPGNHYEIEFLVETLIPILETNGISRAHILDISINFSKARYAIPTIRRMLDKNIRLQTEIRHQISQCSDPDERKFLEESLKDAHKLEPGLMKSLTLLLDEMSVGADQGLSRKQFQEKLREIEIGDQAPAKQLGYIYSTREGGVLMISCENLSLLRAIEQMTAQFVDWHNAEPEDLAKEATNILLKGFTKKW